MATICYKPELSCCSKNFRKMEIYVKNDRFSYNELSGANTTCCEDLRDLYEVGSNADEGKIIKIINKMPIWN